MKKIFSNNIFQGILQGVTVALLIGMLKVGYDVCLRIDEQAIIDKNQDYKLHIFSKNLDEKIERYNNEQKEKNKNTQLRLDYNTSQNNLMLQKLNNIENFIKYKYNFEFTNIK